MLATLFLPALITLAPAAVPDAVQVHPRIWVLKTAPTPETYAALKGAGITYVVNLRKDGEKDFDSEAEAKALSRLDVQYIRVAMGRAPSRDDFDIFRMMFKDLPDHARILVHCGDGNRAAAAVCSLLVLDERKPVEEAIALSKEAGLALPDTEKALRAYLAKAKG